MKITFDAILDHVNSIAYQQQLRENVRILKTRLLKLTSDYEQGTIDKEKFSKQEAEIMKEINVLIGQITTSSSGTTQSAKNYRDLTGLL